MPGPFLPVHLLALPGAQTAPAAGLAEMFALAARLCPSAPVLHLAGPEGARALVVPPNLHQPDPEPPAEAVALVGAALQAGQPVAALCAGALVLARSGVLGARLVALAPPLHPLLARHAPQARAVSRPGALWDGQVLTAAAPGDWPLLGLGLLDRLAGRKTALTLAAHYSGTLPEAACPAAPAEDPVILRAQARIAASTGPLALETLAAELALSPRSLHRRFRAATGLAPAEYQQSQRMGRAAQRLAHSADPIGLIGLDLGYADAAAFSRAFRRAMGLGPRDYREAARETGRQAATSAAR